MVTLSFIGITFAYFYYKNINDQVDPRVVEARKIYNDYNRLAQEDSLDEIVELLTKVKLIYHDIPHYKNSYEMGVVFNNIAAVFISKAIRDTINSVYDSTDEGKQKLYLLKQGDTFVRKGIRVYENWKKTFFKLSEEGIAKNIRKEFLTGLEKYSQKEQEKYLEKRVEEILEAQRDINRRLSVAYTNLGIVYRHLEEYEKAAECYTKAIDFWDRNLTAENNLRLLLGKPAKKRRTIEKIFPPEKDK